MSPQRQKIEFEPNIPVSMTLEFYGGKQVPARNGVQYLYWVDGNRSMFADPEPHEMIQASGAKQGDTIEVTKTLRGKKIGWEVVHVVDDPDDDSAQETAAQAALRNSQTAPQARPAAAPPAPARKTAPAAAAAAPIAEPAPVLTRTTLDLVSCFVAAIDALQEAKDYGKRKGLDLRFDSGDVRSLAISVYIDKCKGGR